MPRNSPFRARRPLEVSIMQPSPTPEAGAHSNSNMTPPPGPWSPLSPCPRVCFLGCFLTRTLSTRSSRPLFSPWAPALIPCTTPPKRAPPPGQAPRFLLPWPHCPSDAGPTAKRCPNSSCPIRPTPPLVSTGAQAPPVEGSHDTPVHGVPRQPLRWHGLHTVGLSLSLLPHLQCTFRGTAPVTQQALTASQDERTNR